MVEEVWGQNADEKRCCYFSPYSYVLTPFAREKINVPMENDIQLTGIIESKEFVDMFKTTALKAIIWELSKLKLTEGQIKQGEVMISQLSALFKKDAAEALIPSDFAHKCGIRHSYPISSGKVKLPPLAKGKKP